ncbi:MAG: sugar transferase [Thiomonas sp.]|uniref:Putative UDP-sugar lipid carrier transferase WcaJ n=1 Tax=mine drainage metagenome TaxID=410659 RepID=E6PNX2_9ZZZZ
MKRLFDLATVLPAALLLALPMALVALAVWFDSGRPVLFGQLRVGRGGRPFKVLKFRSMVVDAERLGPQRTASGDPRITRVGRILRRTSLDELPQLINVLRGDMSLVGPRPDVPAQAADYTPADWALRCSVRPGITGLAQALYRSRATPQQRLQADLDYVRHHGVRRDLYIIWLTARQLFRASGN